ncbi:MAG TPA: hypothetical protein VGD27_18115 [Longimicrobiales bacterium]
MTVETLPRPETPPAAPVPPPVQPVPTRPERRRSSRSWPSWLLRVFVESFFIMFSILLALAVDNWSETRRYQQLAQQSLSIFERELRQNLARLEDVAPYHSGLRSVVAEAVANPEQAADMRSIVEGLKPTVLLNTAWQTALATGALTHIDVETVSALSLTYSIQERFRENARASLPRVAIAGDLPPTEFTRMVHDTHAYLNELVAGEQELRGVYKQAIEIIRSGLREPIRPAAPDSSL